MKPTINLIIFGRVPEQLKSCIEPHLYIKMISNHGTKSKEQHPFDQFYAPHNVFVGNIYKYILTSVDVS